MPEPRPARAVLALLLLFGLPCSALAQSPAPMTPAAFAAELQRLASVVSAGEPGSVPRAEVPAVWTIESDGQRFELPALWLRRELDAARRDPSTWPSRRATIRARLEALRLEADALAASRGAASGRSNDDQAALAGVLAGPEFRHLSQRSAMSRLRQQVSAWMVRLWDFLGGGRIGRRGTALVFAWLAALLAFGVLTAWLVRTLRRPDNDRRLALGPPPVARQSARAWARAATTATDPREAGRFAYRAIVCRLEEEGVWRTDETRTPREYLRLLPGHHRRRSLLSDATRRFEEIWYGAREATEDDRRAWVISLRELGCLPAE